jgi:hypothetical protein
MAVNYHNKKHENPSRNRVPKKNIFVDLSKQRIAERRKTMLQDFKNFNVESDIDELVALSAFGKQLRSEFEAQKVTVPEYVSDNLNTISREISSRMEDRRATRIRQLKSERESLKTAQEKRAQIDKELADLGESI